MTDRGLLLGGVAALLLGLAGLSLSWGLATAQAPTSSWEAWLGTRPAPSASATPRSGSTSGQDNSSTFMGVADPSAPYDLRFIDEMVMHHRGAIVSSRMMISGSKRVELRDLAQRIQDGQQRQIERMLAWRGQWYPDAAEPGTNADSMGRMMEGMMGNQGGGMMGMMGGGMMGGQDQADRMFLRMMIPHHQIAIDMAEDALNNAAHEELKGLAREIIAEQSAEITEMEGYLREWYGEESTRNMATNMREMMQRICGP